MVSEERNLLVSRRPEQIMAQPTFRSKQRGRSCANILDRIFAPVHAKPRIAVECDSASSLITEVEAGRGIALATRSSNS